MIGKPLRALLAFSLRRNVPRVLSTRMPPGAYKAFNGLRFLSMCWIILGHTWQLGTYVVLFSGKLPIYGIGRYSVWCAVVLVIHTYLHDRDLDRLLIHFSTFPLHCVTHQWARDKLCSDITLWWSIFIKQCFPQ